MIDQRVPQPYEGDVRELRLALVCYGGVSLAIYMHGITKEIHRLVRASETFNAAPADDRASNPFPARTTEHVYWNALAASAAAEQLRTRVVVDVIAGTSAGGINGICLAKALAGNRSQDALKNLWIDKGDIGLLMRGWRLLPWQARLAFLVVPPTRPLLRGDEMCQWLYGAFEAMDSVPAAPSLIPADRTLELFVPITDFHGYERHFPIETPLFVRDRTHRHLMAFRHDGVDVTQFTRDYNHALAFAARATSSFPGAFPPITFATYQDAVGAKGRELGGRAKEFFSLYELSGIAPADAYFIDGGVLNNYPFGPAIEAIQRKPAASEVDRRLVYIEPDPSFTDGLGLGRPAPAGAPSLIVTALGAYAKIPSNQPIIDELTRLAERNRVVRRVRDVIEKSFQPVAARIEALLAARQIRLVEVFIRSGEGIAELTQAVEDAAIADAGLNYATYLRLRLATLTDAYAALIADTLHFPPTSYQEAFVGGVLRRWVQDDDVIAHDGTPTVLGRALLTALDLSYHERRLRFVIAALSWWYRPTEPFEVPRRQELDRAKARVYQAIADIQGIVRGMAAERDTQALLEQVFTAEVIDKALAARASVDTYLEKHHEPLDRLRDVLRARIADRLPDIEEALYSDLRGMAHTWSEGAQRALLVRYIGFPYWDILVYPIQALGHVGERDHVETFRISPHEAQLLHPPRPAEGKLKGVSLSHFGAFLERPYRQNDYLWGRLDAAERLIDLLLYRAPEGLDQRKRALQLDALAAALDEERDLRQSLPDVFVTLDDQLRRLRTA
jgi:patatin-related protein